MASEEWVQAQLERTVAAFTTALELKLSPGAQVYTQNLVELAARRLAYDEPVDDEEALTRAQSQLMSLIYRASGGEEFRAGRPPWHLPERRGTVDEYELVEELQKLCPGFWPFC